MASTNYDCTLENDRRSTPNEQEMRLGCKLQPSRFQDVMPPVEIAIPSTTSERHSKIERKRNWEKKSFEMRWRERGRKKRKENIQKDKKEGDRIHFFFLTEHFNRNVGPRIP